MSGRKVIIGLFLVVLGVLLLGRTLGFLEWTVGRLVGYLLPLFLIALGLWLLARTRGQEQAAKAEESGSPFPPGRPTVSTGHRSTSPPPPTPVMSIASGSESGRPSATPEQGKGNRIRYNKFMGDLFVDCSGIDLQNVEIGSFIGDVEVKLHGGKLGRGLNRMIISGFIGDVRVLVPEGMAVFSQSSNFIGDIEMMGRRSSGVGNSLDAQTPGYGDAENKLYIAANHFIGDVRVYVV